MPRGYTLIDFNAPSFLYPNDDEVVRFYEYLRANFHSIVPGIPPHCEVDLIASGDAHNPGLMAMLGLYFPQGSDAELPEISGIFDSIKLWCDSLSAEEIKQIVQKTNSPAWAELIRLGVYPSRNMAL